MPNVSREKIPTAKSKKFPKGTFEVLNPGEFSAKYDISTHLGNGAYGSVNKCTLKEDSKVVRAVKKVWKSDAVIEQQKFLAEMEMLRKVSHPNVLQVIELFEDQTHYYIVTEYFEGQELLDKVNNQMKKQIFFDEHEICHIMKGILEAINYCHTSKICHRDIKPENILINDKNEIKIIDFGFAKIVSSNHKNLSGQDGTIVYMAPEVLSGNPYNEKCDIWSIGFMFYILLAFDMPFLNDTLRAQGNYKTENLLQRSPLANNLLKKMFLVNPDKRISAQQALKHEWFQKFNCKDHQEKIDES